MAQQERATRTRAAVIDAAAAEFDAHGYEGTSLAMISKTAGLSMGAVTFHFASKSALADTVQEEGRRRTQAALKRATNHSAAALETAMRVTVELTGLLEREPLVRAAVRLVRERPGSDVWSDIWLPSVRELLEEAHEQGHLHSDAQPADVVLLAEMLTAGAEVYLRTRLGSGARFDSASASLERAWQLALDGIAPARPLADPASG
ncbi:TetR/AcrR family transcriptional regulator (plasmid) [Streptomyces sp. NBC_01558]|uniref:TetR/AcrR family transcriptional regulator n=1 Tax=Streptomyces sp. NBC_01558 TaxID=2975878 RepID=UPI002DD87204|nr:TetR/AcrR family transcriptional regulator [Streptomyces sp. NBC_01558]WSD82751.1 TetR/AcrR family transcriptional regulator [Streptomyces sp. NBC_01558]